MSGRFDLFEIARAANSTGAFEKKDLDAVYRRADEIIGIVRKPTRTGPKIAGFFGVPHKKKP